MNFSRETWPAEALRRALQQLREASEGQRHDVLLNSIGRVTDYVAAGDLSRTHVEGEFLAAADAVGLGGKRAKEVRRAIADILAKGDKTKVWYPNAGMNGEPAPTKFRWHDGRVLEVKRDVRRPPSKPPEAPPPLPTIELLRADLRVTHFEGVKAVQGSAELITWEELAESVAVPHEWPTASSVEDAKKRLPLWSFADYEDDNRGKRPDGLADDGTERERMCFVHAVHALALDYDDDPTFSMDQVHAWWGAVRYVAHTSGHHQQPKSKHPALPRGRVILALSRAVDEGEYNVLAEWVRRSARGVVGEDELKNPRRTYFVPAAVAGYEHRANLVDQALDVDAILRQVAEDDQRDADGPVYAQTEDGRPFLVKVPLADGVFVASDDGGYLLIDKDLASEQLNRYWPELPTHAGDPPKAMSFKALHARYGAIAQHVYYTYFGASRFERMASDRGNLHVRVCEAPAVPAVRHDDVWDWLEVAFNQRVLDWLSVLPRLDRPTAGLVLLGGGDIGKSMLAFAAARYFGCSVADYDDVFKGRFNDALLRSPVVFLDERTEVESRSGGFRKMLANSTHPIEGKNRPTATLNGCPRFIVAANSPDPLRLGREELTRRDDEAIGRRILMVDCSQAGADWLAARGHRNYTHDWVNREDGSPGKLVETISWLVENWKAPLGGRLLIDGDAAEWAARAATRAGLSATILDAVRLHMDLTSGERVKFEGKDPFLWHPDQDGVVFVANANLRLHWRALLGESEKVPSHRAVTDALKKLSGQDDPMRLTFPDGERRNVYAVPMSLVPKE